MTTINWTDPETGKPCTHDISGWQLVIVCDRGEIMRQDFVSLVLTTAMRQRTADPFLCSLLSWSEAMPTLADPPESWIDMRIERRA